MRLARPFLTDADRARVLAAVRRAEARTGAEFVTVVARSSSDYVGLRLVMPALAALLLPLPLLLSGLASGAWAVWEWQIGVFVALALLTLWTPLVHWLVPRRVQRAHAAMFARAQFVSLGLAGTRDRASVLLFVSVAEHHVEILADRGVAERIDPAAWRAIVDGFVADVRRGCAAEAFERAIDALGGLLAREFPRRPDDANELADAFVEL